MQEISKESSTFELGVEDPRPYNGCAALQTFRGCHPARPREQDGIWRYPGHPDGEDGCGLRVSSRSWLWLRRLPEDRYLSCRQAERKGMGVER